eukprot:4635759-Lingulodinium_polyedra.AAC.1
MERATRAIRDALRPRMVDSIASLRTVYETVHNDAAESTGRGRNASQIARAARSMRTPFFGVRMERVTRAICDALRPRTVDVNAACVLLGCCLGAAR